MKRAIVLMFDTLIRKHLSPYGGDPSLTPNFERLAQKSATFLNCYAGSMPCMPARREMHTGRYNFLHRSWGPLEPFDDSVPEILSNAGIYSHLATDHYHYWEDGGLNYHTRFDSAELFRGQEGDGWKGQVRVPERPLSLNADNHRTRQNWVNRQYQPTEAEHPQTLTVDAGVAFLESNANDDLWFIQIECFDPHEPFFVPDRFTSNINEEYDGPHVDWPAYRRVIEDKETSQHLTNQYLALLRMCDYSLGRVMDAMDRLGLWDDTLLIVCTDHGFLLGEHGWWGKSVVPWYDETIHNPLFVWDPREPSTAQSRPDALVQTIDIAPTLLDFFGLPITADMQGVSLRDSFNARTPTRKGALFGSAGGHVSVTDGRYVYMRSCVREDNRPFFDYTLMPTHMHSRFTPEELEGAELVAPFRFTKNVPVLKVPGWSFGNPYHFGTLLFDLLDDPGQLNPIEDDDLELRMCRVLVELMCVNDAPQEQFERLGLPTDASQVTRDHLLVRDQFQLIERSRRLPLRLVEAPEDSLAARSSIGDLLEDEIASTILTDAMPDLTNPDTVRRFARTNLITFLAGRPAFTSEDALRLLDELDRAVKAGSEVTA